MSKETNKWMNKHTHGLKMKKTEIQKSGHLVISADPIREICLSLLNSKNNVLPTKIYVT